MAITNGSLVEVKTWDTNYGGKDGIVVGMGFYREGTPFALVSLNCNKLGLPLPFPLVNLRLL